jgi:hypothetical protein
MVFSNFTKIQNILIFLNLGGSITITSPSIDGSGTIHANGGAGSADGYGGGGGRIYYAIASGMEEEEARGGEY